MQGASGAWKASLPDAWRLDASADARSARGTAAAGCNAAAPRRTLCEEAGGRGMRKACL
jgi:hypothetical protein